MTFEAMLRHCKTGGKAARSSWTSGAHVFIEGLRLGVVMPTNLELLGIDIDRDLANAGRRIRTLGYTPTIEEKAATDWEPA